MKVDMAGGAAVIAALRAASLLNAPIKVIGVVPVTENMPGGRAIKPGDVLTGAGGKTVEVVNTDAEGRLILGDGLWYAQQLGATHLVDIATLTGACVVALGRGHSGLFGRPDDFAAAARDLGAVTGDRLWPMPVTDDYFEQLKSEAADMSNTGGRPAGAVTAAVFLKQFAGELPWMHLDIAGTALADDARPWQGKGATGVGVRVMAELALIRGAGHSRLPDALHWERGAPGLTHHRQGHRPADRQRDARRHPAARSRPDRRHHARRAAARDRARRPVHPGSHPKPAQRVQRREQRRAVAHCRAAVFTALSDR